MNKPAVILPLGVSSVWGPARLAFLYAVGLYLSAALDELQLYVTTALAGQGAGVP